MSEVQRFWSHEASNIRCVREADFDRVTAERDAALETLKASREVGVSDQQTIQNLVSERDALQQLLTAADERVDSAIALLECVLDTGELTREKHLELEADICQLVTDFWGDRKAARIPSPPRCPDCGYTEQDCREHMDHHLCGSPEPAAARKP